MLNHLPEQLVLYLLQCVDYESQMITCLCSKRYYQCWKDYLRQIYLTPVVLNDFEKFSSTILLLCKHYSLQLNCSLPKGPSSSLSFSLSGVKRLLCRYHDFHSIFSGENILFENIQSLFLFRPYDPETLGFKELDTIFDELCNDFRVYHKHLQLTELIMHDLPILLHSFPFPRSLRVLQFQRANIRSINFMSTFSHLHKLVLANCPELNDISLCGNIPHLSISDCNNIVDISHLNNNMIVEIIRCQKVKDFSKSFQNSVRISIAVSTTSNTEESYQFNLSHWHCVVSLSLEALISPSTAQFQTDYPLLPTTVKRCCLKSKFVELINWKPHCRQLTQLSLGNCSISSMEGLEFDQIKILSLDSVQGLISLRGLGGRNEKVDIRYCEQLQDISAIGSVPIVSITTRAPFMSIHQLSSVHELSINADSLRLERNQDYSYIKQLDIRCVKRIPSFDILRNVPRIIFRADALYHFRDYLSRTSQVLFECITIDESAAFPKLIAISIYSLYQQYLQSSYSFHVIRMESNSLNFSCFHRYILIRKK